MIGHKFFNMYEIYREISTFILGTDHLTFGGGGGGEGGYVFFNKKNILIPNVAEKNILILVEKKK